MKSTIEKYKSGRVNFYDVIIKDNSGRYKRRITTSSLKDARLAKRRIDLL